MSDTIDNESKESQPQEAVEAVEAVEVEAAPPAAEPSESPEAAPQESGPRTETRESSQERPDRRPPRRDSTDSRDRGQGGEYAPRVPRFRRKVCLFCQERNIKVDYKRPDILERFITDRGKILPRRVTGTCSKHQRHVAREIKRARIIALLPFVEQ